MRDAHQSLLATRLRTLDMTAIAPTTRACCRKLFSVECWGGARSTWRAFPREDPCSGSRLLRERHAELLLQMLLRLRQCGGLANYLDNVVRFFVALRRPEPASTCSASSTRSTGREMRVAIDAVLQAGKLCEASICYTGNLSDPHERKYTLDYYLQLARELKAAAPCAPASRTWRAGAAARAYTLARP